MSNESVYTDDRVRVLPANVGNTRQLTLYTDTAQRVRSYAGRIAVDNPKQPGARDHLFYWFFESRTCSVQVPVSEQRELVESTPLLIWLNGGPGASSLLGLFLENGPFRILNDDTGTIVDRPSSWNQAAHVMYWDQPVGTGYSHSDATDGYATSEEQLRATFYDALQGFFDLHPEYAKCPLYVMGESYAGKYVPHIATEIDWRNRNTSRRPLNLKGIAVGDGWMQPALEIRELIDYAYTTGFMSTAQKKRLDVSYVEYAKLVDGGEMRAARTAGNQIVSDVVACGGGFDLYDVRRWDDLPMGALAAYLGTDDVKQALNVPTDVEWACADDEGPVSEALAEDNMADCTPLFTQLLRARDGDRDAYRLLFYTGNFDTACGYLSTEKILYDLPKWDDGDGWKTADRQVWTLGQEPPKGFLTQVRNLTQVSIPGAGHQVPSFKPAICREMIYNWLFERRFPGYVPSIESADTPAAEPARRLPAGGPS